jgi:hypothetical protein
MAEAPDFHLRKAEYRDFLLILESDRFKNRALTLRTRLASLASLCFKANVAHLVKTL